MKIELKNNKVFFNKGTDIQEIHPFWLRERVSGEEFIDKSNHQRLFDPNSLDPEIRIEKAQIKEDTLELNFNDGVNSKLNIETIIHEFSKEDDLVSSIKKIKWDSNLKNIKNFNYKDGFFETKEMYDLLTSFYENGFVIVKNVPTKNWKMPIDEIPATKFTKLKGATGNIRMAATPTIPLRFSFSSTAATFGPPIFLSPALPDSLPIPNMIAELISAPMMP